MTFLQLGSDLFCSNVSFMIDNDLDSHDQKKWRTEAVGGKMQACKHPYGKCGVMSEENDMRGDTEKKLTKPF